MKTNLVLESQEESQEPSLEDEVRPIDAAKHIARAKHSLTCFRSTIAGSGTYPELDEAITELEIALNILTDSTGGML
jgi:hypothetical protein